MTIVGKDILQNIDAITVDDADVTGAGDTVVSVLSLSFHAVHFLHLYRNSSTPQHIHRHFIPPLHSSLIDRITPPLPTRARIPLPRSFSQKRSGSSWRESTLTAFMRPLPRTEKGGGDPLRRASSAAIDSRDNLICAPTFSALAMT